MSHADLLLDIHTKVTGIGEGNRVEEGQTG